MLSPVPASTVRRMSIRPTEPEAGELEEEGYVPPDPDEPPPLELWSAVGDIQPWGTGLLLLAWSTLFAAMAFRREFADSSALLAWGASVTGLDPLASAWRLLASTFIHAGVAHVFFNATSMLIFGPAVERIFTRWGFCVVYAAGGAGASLASLMWREWRQGSGTSLSVGASGAIFALGGALLMSAFRVRRRLAPGRARALGAALLFLVGQGLVAGITRNGTDNIAHMAGLVAGLVLGACIPLSPRLGGKPTGLAIRIIGSLAALGIILSFALAVRGGVGYG